MQRFDSELRKCWYFSCNATCSGKFLAKASIAIAMMLLPAMLLIRNGNIDGNFYV